MGGDRAAQARDIVELQAIIEKQRTPANHVRTVRARA
jgi:hypothetical protein